MTKVVLFFILAIGFGSASQAGTAADPAADSTVPLSAVKYDLGSAGQSANQNASAVVEQFNRVVTAAANPLGTTDCGCHARLVELSKTPSRHIIEVAHGIGPRHKMFGPAIHLDSPRIGRHASDSHDEFRIFGGIGNAPVMRGSSSTSVVGGSWTYHFESVGVLP